MTFEEFQTATEVELTYATKQCFDRFNSPLTGGGDKPACLLEAQFYMQELGRREDSRVATRDFRMELIVIFLIGLELVAAVVLAIVGSRQQGQDTNQQLAAFGKMQDVMSRLQESSKATADTLQSLQSTTQSMNDRIGTQLGRMAQMAIDFAMNVPQNKADLFNRGNVDLTIWGYKVDGEPARTYKKPISIKRSEHLNLATLLSDIKNANGQGNLDIFLRDDFENEFIAEILVPSPNVLGMGATFDIVQRRWSK